MTATTTGRFDLHTHSLFSDGTETPYVIAQGVAEVSALNGFALTDHDTIKGWGDAREAAQKFSLDFIPGMEVTTKFEGVSRHLLAYGFDADNAELFAAIDEVRVSRESRVQRMFERLAEDYDFTLDGIVEPGKTVGRPHLADALVRAGYATTRNEVFDTILHSDSIYYIPNQAIDTVDAIRMVHAAGGVTVIAHPAATRQKAPMSVAALGKLGDAGLWGVELDHPENRPEWVPELAEAAETFGLVVTGSSDYHGLTGKPNRLGDGSSAREVVERMREIVVTPN